MKPGEYWIYWLWGWEGNLSPGSQWIGPHKAQFNGQSWSTGFFSGYPEGHQSIRIIREVREGEEEFPHRWNGWYRIRYNPNWGNRFGPWGPKPFVTVAHCEKGQWSGPLFRDFSCGHPAIMEVLEEWHEPSAEEWEGLMDPTFA